MPAKRIRRAATSVVKRVTAPIRWVGRQYKKEATERKAKDDKYRWEAQVRANNAAGGYAGSVTRKTRRVIGKQRRVKK